MKNTFLPILLFISMVLFFGCKDNDPVSGNGKTGDLTGQVTLLDSNGMSVQDRSGVSVQIEGTPYSAVTDTAGYWTIKNLPSSTYSISFSKATYNTWKNTSFEFIGGGTMWFGVNFPNNGSTLTLIQSPSYIITIDSVQSIGSISLQSYDSISLIPILDTVGHDSTIFHGYDTTHHQALRPILNGVGSILGRLSTQITGTQRNVRIMISLNPNPDINDPSTYITYNDFYLNNQFLGHTSESFIVGLANQFSMPGVSKGETLYVRAYPVAVEGISGYYDINSHKTIHYGYGAASNVVKFTY